VESANDDPLLSRGYEVVQIPDVATEVTSIPPGGPVVPIHVLFESGVTVREFSDHDVEVRLQRKIKVRRTGGQLIYLCVARVTEDGVLSCAPGAQMVGNEYVIA
jgi:hypothetical protein